VAGLIRLLVDNVSKNGNLLLNVGPKADGTLNEIQVQRLRGMGKWLRVNGEAIYGTGPWIIPEAKTREGIDIRFTLKGKSVFAILLDKPTRKVTIDALHAKEGTRIRHLGSEGTLKWTQKGTSLEIEMPVSLPDSEAYSIEIAEEPFCLLKKEMLPRRLTVLDLQRMAFKPHW
jgi:alpha-L-fucosidase